MVLISNDSVIFYTTESILLEMSSNSFHNLLPIPKRPHPSVDPSERFLFLPEFHSSELEIFLQAVYSVPRMGATSFVDINPLIRAIDHLPKYGIEPSAVITPISHLYQTILSCAPINPLEIYALAAQYGMASLAMTVSSHTLVVELSQVSDDLSKRMGSVYLLRLFQLHMGRMDTLKGLLTAELGLHNPTPECDFGKQKLLKERWNLGVASLLFLMRPDTTTTLIREQMLEHTSDLSCPDCQRLRDTRLNRIINEWSMAKRTITL
ncbi:hypothetical protein L218DRAFT_159304 [Marasmius fiardii PR-910]|nr:hypothetical protein L218DRAFT_159304 [Marasmius fiardii PR-910]